MALDRQPDGSWTPGGPSLYCALAARRLGADVTLVTRLPEGYPGGLMSGLRIAATSASRVPRYVNTYAPGGRRSQLLLDPGEPLDAQAAAPADLLVVAPAFRELVTVGVFPAPLRTAVLQGALRALRRDGRVVRRARPMQAVSGLLGPTPCLAVYSEADTADPAGLARVIAAAGHWAVVTRGPRGVSWWAPGNHAERTQPAFPAVEVEPTGAGDCFAVACAMRARELALDGALDADVVQEAVAFGQAAAACSVEGIGPAELPTRAAVEERLAGREAA